MVIMIPNISCTILRISQNQKFKQRGVHEGLVLNLNQSGVRECLWDMNFHRTNQWIAILLNNRFEE